MTLKNTQFSSNNCFKDRNFRSTNFLKFCETWNFSEKFSSEGSFAKTDTRKRGLETHLLKLIKHYASELKLVKCF